MLCISGTALDESNFLYIHSHTNVYLNGLVPPNPGQSDMSYVAGQARGAGPGRGGGATVQGLPLLKPPYDRITAYNMNTGDIVWQKTHSSTPDNIRNHPALKGLNLPRTGVPGRTFIGVLTTKNLVIAGDGGVHTNAADRRVALLRAYDKLTGEDAGSRGDAEQADRLADVVSDRRQAVHRPGGERERRRGAARVRASLNSRLHLEKLRAEDPSGHSSHGGANQGTLQAGIIAVAAVSFDECAEIRSREEAAGRPERSAEYASHHRTLVAGGSRLYRGGRHSLAGDTTVVHRVERVTNRLEGVDSPTRQVGVQRHFWQVSRATPDMLRPTRSIFDPSIPRNGQLADERAHLFGHANL